MGADLAFISPWIAIFGGLLIGTATALYLLVSGRVAGVSGTIAAAVGLSPGGPRRGEAAAFIARLPLGALAIAAISPPHPVVIASAPTLVVAGLLVGFGTRLGNGCTSGHGVCGVARLSPRSLGATATFVASAIATVFVVRHLVAA